MARWSVLGLVLLVGCGSDGAATDAGGGGDGRTGRRACPPGIMPLELGRCVRAAGGECNGTLAENGQFAPVAGTMALVVGPQRATMIVFAARAAGIDPGDPMQPTASTNPLVEINLIDNATSQQLTLYEQRRPFLPDATMPGSFTDAENWVVVDMIALELNGRSLTAVATVRDRNGEERCGTVSFTAFQI